MLAFTKRSVEHDDLSVQRAAELLDALGMTTALPEMLTQDALGRQFEPEQINVQGDLVGQFTLLLRPDPLGGAEPQIYENGRRIEALADQQFHRALANMAESPRSLLHELLTEARTRKEYLEAAYTQATDRYARLQARLHKWQQRTEQRTSGTGTIWRWLLGGGDQLSVVDAAMLWNERELLALQRSALQAAIAIAARLVELIAQLLAQLDTRLGQARQARAQLAHEHAQRAQAPALYAPWTYRVLPQAVVGALTTRVDLDGLLADVLQQLATPSDLDLSALVRARARQAADQALAALEIADLIALDAGMDGPPDCDPLVPIGQKLLERTQRAAWQLARGARPRVETLQVTADGAPLFSLDGLQSAASGGDSWRMGFVAVQLAVAREDLALWRDADELFQATLRQRNVYVIDDLAIAWEAAQGARLSPASADAPPDQVVHNGQHDEPVGELDR
jgi:hypothetical protein